MDQVFDLLDTDNDGLISYADVYRVMADMDTGEPNSEDINLLIGMGDPRGVHGGVTRAAWLRAMQDSAFQRFIEGPNEEETERKPAAGSTRAAKEQKAEEGKRLSTPRSAPRRSTPTGKKK
jgi:hypothetical protein